MKTLVCLFLALFLCPGLFSQSTIRKFKKLSTPEKCWVFAHPFKAKKAMKITSEVITVVDSVKRSGSIGTDLNGGKLDAFKHAYWMAALSLEIGAKKSLKLGKAHEKGNYREYKKHRLEDSILPDSASSAMDLHNNVAGIAALENGKTFSSAKEVQLKIMNALKKGDLLIIKKDKLGNYLYCDGTFIDTNEWKGKWNIPKCLVSSNQE